MSRELPTRRHMLRIVVVIVGERTSTWRRVVGLLEFWFCLEVDRGTVHLMLGLTAKVEVVTEKIISVAARCFDDGGNPNLPLL